MRRKRSRGLPASGRDLLFPSVAQLFRPQRLGLAFLAPKKGKTYRRAPTCNRIEPNQRPQRAQPLSLVASGYAGHSKETARDKREEGGDDVKSAWPLCPGLHTCYNARHRGLPTREGELILEKRAQFGLESATRLHEAGIASNGASDRCREYVLGPCTHRPSHHERGLY